MRSRSGGGGSPRRGRVPDEHAEEEHSCRSLALCSGPPSIDECRELLGLYEDRPRSSADVKRIVSVRRAYPPRQRLQGRSQAGLPDHRQPGQPIPRCLTTTLRLSPGLRGTGKPAHPGCEPGQGFPDLCRTREHALVINGGARTTHHRCSSGPTSSPQCPRFSAAVTVERNGAAVRRGSVHDQLPVHESPTDDPQNDALDLREGVHFAGIVTLHARSRGDWDLSSPDLGNPNAEGGARRAVGRSVA